MQSLSDKLGYRPRPVPTCWTALHLKNFSLFKICSELLQLFALLCTDLTLPLLRSQWPLGSRRARPQSRQLQKLYALG